MVIWEVNLIWGIAQVRLEYGLAVEGYLDC